MRQFAADRRVLCAARRAFAGIVPVEPEQDGLTNAFQDAWQHFTAVAMPQRHFRIVGEACRGLAIELRIELDRVQFFEVAAQGSKRVAEQRAGFDEDAEPIALCPLAQKRAFDVRRHGQWMALLPPAPLCFPLAQPVADAARGVAPCPTMTERG